MPTSRFRNYSGGIAQDARSEQVNQYQISRHFDTFQFDNKLQPHRDWETDESFGGGAKTDEIVKFLIDGENGVLYGYGKNDAGANQPQLYKKSTSDITSSWTDVANGTTGTSGVRDPNLFSYYQGNIYGWRANQNLWEYDISADSFTDSRMTASASWTNASGGLVHLQDASLLFGHDNFLSRVKDGVASEKILTLSADHRISDIDQKGIYALIAMAPLRNSGSSYLAIWDTADGNAVPVPQESIDLGEGTVVYVGNVGGTIVCVMQVGSALYGNLRLAVKEIRGTGAFEVLSLDLEELGASLTPNTKTYESGNLMFPIVTSLDGANTGLVKIGPHPSTGQLSISLDRHIEVTAIQGCFASRGIVWVGHGTDGSISRTSDTRQYSTSLASVYESLVNHDMPIADKEKEKTLQKVLITTEPLPASGSIVVKYKTEHDSTWQSFTPDITNSTNDSTVTEFNPSIRHFYDIEFRVESLGGATITGGSYRYQTLDGK